MADSQSANLSRAVTGGTADTTVGSAGGTPTLTYAAGGAGVAHVLAGLIWSYSGTPTAGSITVAQGTAGAVFTQIDVTAPGPGFLPFSPPLRTTGNQQLVITGYPGGTANVVKLNATHWTES